MAVGAVARKRDVFELRGSTRDSPRLAQWSAARAWHLAGQTVHAPVKIERSAAPTAEAGLNLTVTPVSAGLRPFYRHVTTIGDTCLSDNPEVAPKAVEDRPMLADLRAGSGPLIPVNALVCRPSGARDATIEESRDTRC